MREILKKLSNYWINKGVYDPMEIVVTKKELGSISKSENKEITFGDVYMGLKLKEK